MSTGIAARQFLRNPGSMDDSRAGFTILEIMIATAILTLGLVGILALFPVAIHTGKVIVDRSTAVVIAESVAESIREGLRNNLRHVTNSVATNTYFIFNHDGVKDQVPSRKELERPDKDYYILLPRFRPGRAGQFVNRKDSLISPDAKTFLYPETDSNANGGGNAFEADDDSKDSGVDASGRGKGIRVTRTYTLGNTLPAEDATGTNVLDDQKIDSLKQYSYAFLIEPSVNDGNLSDPTAAIYEPANRLYHVRVMVYRGFPKEGLSSDMNPPDPVFEFDFEVAI